MPKQTGRKKPGLNKTVRSAESASEMSTALVPQRDTARSPRLEETDTGEELAPIRSVELNEGRALVRELLRRLESLEDRMTRSESVVDRLCHVQH